MLAKLKFRQKGPRRRATRVMRDAPLRSPRTRNSHVTFGTDFAEGCAHIPIATLIQSQLVYQIPILCTDDAFPPPWHLAGRRTPKDVCCTQARIKVNNVQVHARTKMLKLAGLAGKRAQKELADLVRDAQQTGRTRLPARALMHEHPPNRKLELTACPLQMSAMSSGADIAHALHRLRNLRLMGRAWCLSLHGLPSFNDACMVELI